MTQEQRNKEIATMLGWIDADGDLVIPNHISAGSNYSEWADTKKVARDDIFKGHVETCYINTTDTGFSYDWNWLMEAVKFIYSKLSPTDSRRHDLIQRVGRGNIQDAFIAISDLAKLYNNN